MRKLLLVSLSCLLLASCGKKEDDDSSSNNPAPTPMALTGTLNDTTFTADYFSSSYPGPLLQLYGYETHSNRSITLTLDNKNTGTHTMTLDLNGTNAFCQDGGGIGYYSNHGAGHGSITVSASSSSKVSGTFSFMGYNLSGTDSAEISGEFTNFTF